MDTFCFFKCKIVLVTKKNVLYIIVICLFTRVRKFFFSEKRKIVICLFTRACTEEGNYVNELFKEESVWSR